MKLFNTFESVFRLMIELLYFLAEGAAFIVPQVRLQISTVVVSILKYLLISE
jgi:hypothetical protein